MMTTLLFGFLLFFLLVSKPLTLMAICYLIGTLLSAFRSRCAQLLWSYNSG